MRIKAISLMVTLIACGAALAQGGSMNISRHDKIVEQVDKALNDVFDNQGVLMTKAVKSDLVYNVERLSLENPTMNALMQEHFLEKYPVIHLIVRPVPPRDYTVQINGEEYPATEESRYGVLPGIVKLKVVRAKQPPCVWERRVTKNVEVNCEL